MRWDDSGWWLALIVWAIVLGPMVFAAGRSVERRHRNNKVRALLQFRAGVDEARDQLAEVLTRMGLTVDELREQADRKAELEAIILGPDDGIVIRVSGTPTKKEIEEMKSRWSENFPDNRLGILLNCDDVMVARKMEFEAVAPDEGDGALHGDPFGDEHYATCAPCRNMRDRRGVPGQRKPAEDYGVDVIAMADEYERTREARK